MVLVGVTRCRSFRGVNFVNHKAARVKRLGASLCPPARADVHQGTQRDAVLWSVGANSQHGYRRTNEDKRRAVLVLLNDSEWAGWSDSEIARRCAVDHKTVGSLRQSILGNSQDSAVRTLRRSGQTFGDSPFLLLVVRIVLNKGNVTSKGAATICRNPTDIEGCPGKRLGLAKILDPDRADRNSSRSPRRNAVRASVIWAAERSSAPPSSDLSSH